MTRKFTSDINDLDPAYVGELLSDVSPIRESIAPDLFGPKMLETADGKVPYIPPEFRTPSSDSAYVGKVGLTSAPEPIEIDMEKIDISTDGKFSRKAKVSRHTDEVLSELETAEGLVGYLGAVVQGFNNVEIEAECRNILQDQSKNATKSTQSKWTSPSSAEPFKDFENCTDVVQQFGEDPDTLVLGLDYARLLAKTSAIKGAAGRSIDATGDAVAMEALREMLVRRFGFDNILIDGEVYQNAANKNQAPDVNRVYDGTAWIGSSEHLIVREKEEMNESDSGYDVDHQEYWTLEHKIVDFFRGATDAGVILTDIN